MENPSVLIIDNNPQVRKLLAIALKTSDFNVLWAETDYEALFFITDNKPDLLLLDLKMSSENKQFSISRLKDHFPGSIIVISDRETEGGIAKAIHEGASDFLLKPFRTSDVLSRVRLFLQRDNTDPDKSISPLKDRTVGFLNSVVKRSTNLTEKEKALLSLFLHHEGKLITQQTLLEKVIGISVENGPQTLLALISQLRKKIEVDPDRPTHIVKELGIGYRFLGSSH